MALVKNLTNPIAQPSIDKARLMNVIVDPEKKVMKITLAKGYEDSGEFMVKMVSDHIISGDDYDQLMDASGDPLKTVRESLEEGIWAKLEAMGLIDVQ